jgi:hydrogenase maturation protein HypF
VETGVIAARFHNALVDAIVTVAERTGLAHVALSGGVFQNDLLVTRAAAALRNAGFEVLLHRRVPANDGGIALGQIAIAVATTGP